MAVSTDRLTCTCALIVRQSNSASAYLIHYRELTEAGINSNAELKVRLSGSHSVTAAPVESGAVNAGVLDETVFSFMIASRKIDKSKVRSSHTFQIFVDEVFVARKGVPVAEREELIQAFFGFEKRR